MSIALLAAATTAAPASADWSAPVTVPGSDVPSLAFPTIAFAGSGRGLVSWRAGYPAGATSTPAYRTQRTTATSFRTPLTLENLIAAPMTFGRTRVATLRERRVSGGMGLTADLGTLTGFYGPDRTLERRATIDSQPALAGNRGGDLAAVWSVTSGDHDRLKLALRHPGARFGLGHVIRGSGRISELVVAYGERGDTVIAYQRTSRTPSGHRRYTIEARLRRAHHHFGSVQVLGSSRGFAHIAVAVAPTGRAYIVWSEQDGGEEPTSRCASTRPSRDPGTFCSTARARSGPPAPRHARRADRS